MSRPPLRVWVWTAATVALAVVAVLLWRNSDAAATDSTTALPPVGAPAGTPAGAVSEAWAVPGDPRAADVVEGGRVLAGSDHGVRALEPATGQEVWRYTRANAWLCGLTTTDDVVVAVFRTEDRCDEAVALDAATGVRAWTRNVNFRADMSLSSTDRIVLAHAPTGIVTLDPTGNNIRWRYAPPSGCELLGSAAGDAGVAVLERCAESAALRLRLLDGFDGDEHWTRDLPLPGGADAELLGADQLVGVRVGDRVELLSGPDGTLLTTLAAGPDGAARQSATDGAVLVSAGGTLTAVDPVSGRRLWEAPATGLPGEPVPDGDRSRLTVPGDDGFVHRDAATGEQLDRSLVPGLPAGGTATAVGGTVLLRLPDGIRAYR
ncbi:outer membrane protein assembly factor BamB family protein [Blastococcus sp. VKM Ac-2987]|uniref:outer membrane protein assembly factor BamB family protein n=1 Tax=Blastococcus sp. VKM Ac-2987 TaxID=3004141 RepID=UPI0022ABAAE1|nr:PQQ-binding-like beta-propeller repeat protein [Blastococcus sp. VKM Ac-2987]MCZ2859613.1 PQQ-binding-like beta-propeller repeat protein [Blastococcus sp. VKM Ac-2987]